MCIRDSLEVHNPSDMPDPARVAEIREPMIRASILTPTEFIGAVMELCQEKRGEHAGMHYLSADRVQLEYDLPLVEIVMVKDENRCRLSSLSPVKYSQLSKDETEMLQDLLDKRVRRLE